MPEERLENLESLMDTHYHEGGASMKIDIFDEDDTQTAIDDNDYMYASVAASDDTQREDDTERSLAGSTLQETVYTIQCPYPGTMRIKYEGKQEVSNAQAIVYVYDLKGIELNDYPVGLDSVYEAFEQDVTVRIGYTVKIDLKKFITPTTAYLKNFEVCYDLTKDQGVSFIQ